LYREKMDRVNQTVAFAFLALCVVAVICDVRVVRASEPIYIRADGTVEPIGAPIQRNGDVYILTDNVTSQADGIIIERNSIIFDGSGYTVQGGASGNGFYVNGISNVIIKNARIEGFNYGIYLESTSRNTIYRNDVKGSTYDGIGLYEATNNTVASNNVRDNDWSGIGLYFSLNNNISANYISNNYYGVTSFSSQQNTVVHNNFVANTNQTSSDGLQNTWDNGYPSGGNFWSDYDGTDAYSGPNQDQPGSDGIGDTNYTCDENNLDSYPLMNPWINIAVTDVLPSKSNVGEGYKLYISVTVQNQGWNAQTTKLTVYANTTVVGTIMSLVLPERSQATLNFTWQTTPALKGNYVLSSTVDPVPNEPDIRDNNRTYGRIVKVTLVGDVNGDRVVDIYDAITLSNAFPSVPGSATWNGNADINSDNNVDIYDAILLSVNFGKKI
jgi:parallel beta-helix repeat protein